MTNPEYKIKKAILRVFPDAIVEYAQRKKMGWWEYAVTLNRGNVPIRYTNKIAESLHQNDPQGVAYSLCMDFVQHLTGSISKTIPTTPSENIRNNA